MRAISLCAGIGMEALGMAWAGIEVGALCEIDPWCQSVLHRHWPSVPIIGDIRNVTRESIARIPAHSESEYGLASRIDIIAGGIPCQGHSVAGCRKGASDERNLWPEFRRIVSEIRPTWAVLENVPGLLRSDGGRFFAGVLSDLAAMGYDAGWCVFGAVDMGAPHKRDRLFVIAHAQGIGCEWAGTTREGRYGLKNRADDAHAQSQRSINGTRTLSVQRDGLTRDSRADAPHAPEPGREGRDAALLAEAENGLPAGLHGPSIPDWAGGGWRMPPGLTEPTTRRERTIIEHVRTMDAGRADGLVRRIPKRERRQRIKALGNCNPPQMYYTIFQAIREAENVRS